MHGIVEALAFYAFLGTALAAFVLRLADPPRPVPTMLLVGCWPLLVGLLSEGKAFFDAPSFWFIGVAITLPATAIGSMLAAALLRMRAKRAD